MSSTRYNCWTLLFNGNKVETCLRLKSACLSHYLSINDERQGCMHAYIQKFECNTVLFIFENVFYSMRDTRFVFLVIYERLSLNSYVNLYCALDSQFTDNQFYDTFILPKYTNMLRYYENPKISKNKNDDF